jgi:hypothetical protein
MFSTIANYINSLVVLAKFYFADNPLAEFSFTAECADSDFVLSGLRRVRSQTNAKAKTEAIHKPLHAQWLSWPECQQVRQQCLTAYESKSGAEGKERKERKSASTSASAGAAVSGLLKTLICLMFYTIAPPPRCSIVRLLQWRTTLVKKRSDPTRYVIDLLNCPDAPASQHKVRQSLAVGWLLLADACLFLCHRCADGQVLSTGHFASASFHDQVPGRVPQTPRPQPQRRLGVCKLAQ